MLPCALGRVKNFFQKVFPGRPAGRGAPRPPGFGPSRRRVRYYTRPRRGAGGKPARTQDADNSSAIKRRRPQAEGGIGQAFCLAPRPRRFAPAHRRGRFSFLYISKEIGAHLQARSPSAFIAQAALPPVAGFPLFASAKLLTVRTPAVPPNPHLRRRFPPERETAASWPPAFRAGNPLGDRP